MKRIIAVFLLLVVMFCFISCSKIVRENEQDTTEIITDTFVNDNDITTAPNNIENDSEFYQTDRDTYLIETPYCSLSYPVEWKDYIITEENNTVGIYQIVFRAALEGKEIPLFAIEFGESSDGFKLGTIKNNNKDMAVYLLDMSMFDIGTLSDESASMYYQMSEDINVIISKLIYDYGMIVG